METSKKINVWHDCDPGHDDVLALMYCISNEAINLVGISSVHGNQTTEKTYSNIVRTLYISGAIDLLDKIPVVCGAPIPSVRASQLCPEIHGKTGLGGIDWSDIDNSIINSGHSLVNKKEPSADKVADKIHKVFSSLKKDEELVILVTGCHTNIAKYFTKYPNDVTTGRIKVSAMGGSIKVHGNTGPWQEFNIQIDPEAFATVVESLPPGSLTISPLDITHTVLATDLIIERMRKAAGGIFGDVVKSLLCFFKETYRNVFGLTAPPVHDPVAAYYIVANSQGLVNELGKEYKGSTSPLFQTYLAKAAVETKGTYTSGAICIERYPTVGQCIPGGHIIRICDSCNVDEFWNEMEKTLSTLALKTPLHHRG